MLVGPYLSHPLTSNMKNARYSYVPPRARSLERVHSASAVDGVQNDFAGLLFTRLFYFSPLKRYLNAAIAGESTRLQHQKWRPKFVL